MNHLAASSPLNAASISRHSCPASWLRMPGTVNRPLICAAAALLRPAIASVRETRIIELASHAVTAQHWSCPVLLCFDRPDSTWAADCVCLTSHLCAEWVPTAMADATSPAAEPEGADAPDVVAEKNSPAPASPGLSPPQCGGLLLDEMHSHERPPCICKLFLCLVHFTLGLSPFTSCNRSLWCA